MRESAEPVRAQNWRRACAVEDGGLGVEIGGLHNAYRSCTIVVAQYSVLRSRCVADGYPSIAAGRMLRMNLLQIVDLGKEQIEVAWRCDKAIPRYYSPLPFQDPLSADDRGQLRWYLEEHLQFSGRAE